MQNVVFQPAGVALDNGLADALGYRQQEQLAGNFDISGCQETGEVPIVLSLQIYFTTKWSFLPPPQWSKAPFLFSGLCNSPFWYTHRFGELSPKVCLAWLVRLCYNARGGVGYESARFIGNQEKTEPGSAESHAFVRVLYFRANGR